MLRCLAVHSYTQLLKGNRLKPGRCIAGGYYYESNACNLQRGYDWQISLTRDVKFLEQLFAKDQGGILLQMLKACNLIFVEILSLKCLLLWHLDRYCLIGNIFTRWPTHIPTQHSPGVIFITRTSPQFTAPVVYNHLVLPRNEEGRVMHFAHFRLPVPLSNLLWPTSILTGESALGKQLKSDVVADELVAKCVTQQRHAVSLLLVLQLTLRPNLKSGPGFHSC